MEQEDLIDDIRASVEEEIAKNSDGDELPEVIDKSEVLGSCVGDSCDVDTY